MGPDNAPYYFNSTTGESTWDRPAELESDSDRPLESDSEPATNVTDGNGEGCCIDGSIRPTKAVSAFHVNPAVCTSHVVSSVQSLPGTSSEKLDTEFGGCDTKDSPSGQRCLPEKVPSSRSCGGASAEDGECSRLQIDDDKEKKIESSCGGRGQRGRGRPRGRGGKGRGGGGRGKDTRDGPGAQATVLVGAATALKECSTVPVATVGADPQSSSNFAGGIMTAAEPSLPEVTSAMTASCGNSGERVAAVVEKESAEVMRKKHEDFKTVGAAAAEVTVKEREGIATEAVAAKKVLVAKKAVVEVVAEADAIGEGGAIEKGGGSESCEKMAGDEDGEAAARGNCGQTAAGTEPTGELGLWEADQRAEQHEGASRLEDLSPSRAGDLIQNPQLQSACNGIDGETEEGDVMSVSLDVSTPRSPAHCAAELCTPSSPPPHRRLTESPHNTEQQVDDCVGFKPCGSHGNKAGTYPGPEEVVGHRSPSCHTSPSRQPALSPEPATTKTRLHSSESPSARFGFGGGALESSPVQGGSRICTPLLKGSGEFHIGSPFVHRPCDLVSSVLGPAHDPAASKGCNSSVWLMSSPSNVRPPARPMNRSASSICCRSVSFCLGVNMFPNICTLAPPAPFWHDYPVFCYVFFSSCADDLKTPCSTD